MSILSILFKTPIFLFPNFFLLYFLTFRDKGSFLMFFFDID